MIICFAVISATYEQLFIKFYGGPKRGGEWPKTNQSDFGSRVPERYRDHIHTAVVLKPPCSPGGVTILCGGLCCSCTDCLVCERVQARKVTVVCQERRELKVKAAGYLNPVCQVSKEMPAFPVLLEALDLTVQCSIC